MAECIEGCDLVFNEVVESHDVLGSNTSENRKTLGDSSHLS